MGDDVVVRVEGVSKKYCKSLKRSMVYGVEDIGRNLLGLSSHSERCREGEFWAVDDVSFELRKGETLGLIGPNGSGKSTLLKMLNGIFWPDKGKITVRGRVGALIEVGAGFHPLLTGRENIYVNGAILGMSKKEVNAKFDDIVEFANIGDFIDAPVRSYSSGMFVRLGFAVAVHCEPDILLVDEVLAVGDINFQNRCLRHIAKMMECCAVILVSHNPHHIRFGCNKALFLDRGKTQCIGPSSKVLDEYIAYMMQQTLSSDISIADESKYDSGVDLKSLRLLDKNYRDVCEVFAGESVIIECVIKVAKPVYHAIIGFGLNNDGIEQSFSGFSSQFNGGQYYDLEVGEYVCRIIIPRISLKAGVYNIGVVISEKHVFAQHALKTGKNIFIKNPHPEFGLYDMHVEFEMDKIP